MKTFNYSGGYTMSRYYEIHVEVKNYDAAKEKEYVIADVLTLWGIHNPECYADMVAGTGQRSITDTEEEFSKNLAKEIWKANGSECPVLVRLTFLENLPYEDYLYGVAEDVDWCDVE
jgi:hypothetical protein